MIIVTGGAGFIGSHIVAALNRRGRSDILVVDHLKNGRKIFNLADLDIADYVDRDDFLATIHDLPAARQAYGEVSAVFHQGACSATTEWDGQYIMRNNHSYSKALLEWCAAAGTPFIYASSASVYGNGAHGFVEERRCEKPTNVYAYSKFLFDQHVRALRPSLKSQVVGLRYFNVYGPRESHKGAMASTALHFSKQLESSGIARLFAGHDGHAAGEQRRDFVYVEDCAAINLWFLDQPQVSGIFNVGTGTARSFNDMAAAVIRSHGSGEVQYIEFPPHLRGSYQSYTQADLSALRAAGCDWHFMPIERGVENYLGWLRGQPSLGSAA